MRMRKILSVGLLLVSVGGIAVSAVNLIPYLREEAHSASLYAELAAIHAAGDDSHTDGMIVTPMATTAVTNVEESDQVDGEESLSDETPEPTLPPVIHSGLLALHEKNPDCVAWITIEGTAIDYPVMYRPSPKNYYLHRDFNGNHASAGALFIAENCDPDDSDNVIIYGHHMNSGKMFAALNKYKKLNAQYDDFSKQFGLISATANKRAFQQDSSYCLLAALEVLDENGQLKRKADIFTKRTIRKPEPVESVDTASEALALSIGERARVDLQYMASLCGRTEDEIIDELRGVIFLEPESVEWQTSDEYLSGNMREKLRAAQSAAERDPSYQVNVEYLKRVQPKDLDASEIEVRLGATWIDPQYIDRFIRDEFHTDFWLIGRQIKTQYSKVSGQWNIQGKSADRGNPMVYSTYGTERLNAFHLLEDALNLKDTKVYDTFRDADGEHRVLNKKETMLAQQKQELIRAAFKEWIFKDMRRRETLVAKYNELFNAVRPREYDGSHINSMRTANTSVTPATRSAARKTTTTSTG